MLLPSSRAVAPALEWVASVDSTNAELQRRLAAGESIEGVVLATDDQTAGRGRLGRVWDAPPGGTLAVSVALPFDAERGGWLALAAGLAMHRAVGSVLDRRDVELKWPNDVLVGGDKISGILIELVTPKTVVIGAGVNLFLGAAQLPTPTSTSLVLAGADADRLLDRVLSEYLSQLLALTTAPLPDLRLHVIAACGTVGREVRVVLPAGEDVFGRAERVDDDGRLVVIVDDGAGAPRELVVSAGDITHLRHR